MMNLRRIVWLGIATLMLGGQGIPAYGQQRITVVLQNPIASEGAEVFFHAVPKHMGYFREEGLDVTLQFLGGAGPAAQLLQSGSVQFAATQPESILQLREQGGDAIGFYALRHGNGSKIAVLPDSPFTKLEDFKGKTLGGLSWGAGGGPVLIRMMSDVGVQPDQYQRVTVGAGPSAALALNNKQIDGLVLWDSIFASFENRGMKFRYIEMPMQRQMGALTMATTEQYAKSNPKIVEGFCRAMAKGLHFTRTNMTAAIQMFLDEFPSMRTPAIPAHVHILNTWLQAAMWDVPPGQPAGNFPEGTWQFSQKFYQQQGSLKGTKPAQEGYTTKYLDACNTFDKAAVAAAAEKYAAR